MHTTHAQTSATHRPSSLPAHKVDLYTCAGEGGVRMAPAGGAPRRLFGVRRGRGGLPRCRCRRRRHGRAAATAPACRQAAAAAARQPPAAAPAQITRLVSGKIRRERRPPAPTGAPPPHRRCRRRCRRRRRRRASARPIGRPSTCAGKGGVSRCSGARRGAAMVGGWVRRAAATALPLPLPLLLLLPQPLWAAAHPAGSNRLTPKSVLQRRVGDGSEMRVARWGRVRGGRPSTEASERDGGGRWASRWRPGDPGMRL